jgi:hypothetical protein
VSHRARENIPTSFKLIMSSEIRDNKVLSPQTLKLNKLASFDLGVFDKTRFFNGVQNDDDDIKLRRGDLTKGIKA